MHTISPTHLVYIFFLSFFLCFKPTGNHDKCSFSAQGSVFAGEAGSLQEQVLLSVNAACWSVYLRWGCRATVEPVEMIHRSDRCLVQLDVSLIIPKVWTALSFTIAQIIFVLTVEPSVTVL